MTTILWSSVDSITSSVQVWFFSIFILCVGSDVHSIKFLANERHGISVYTVSESGTVVPVVLPGSQYPLPKYPVATSAVTSGPVPRTFTQPDRGEQEVFTCSGETLVAKNRDHHLHLHYANEDLGKVKGQSRGMRRGQGRIKRQAPTAHNVEVVMVGDYGLYTRFLAANGNNEHLTLLAMTDYYANVFKAVNRRYESTVRPNFSVKVTPTNFVFLTAPNSSPWTENNKVGNNVRAAPALIDFNPFAAVLTSTFGVDHATLITGYDLKSENLQNDLLGVAYTFGVCSEEPSSLVEESFTEQTANTVAHEIGHSLGSPHDGPENACSEEDFFVMAPTSALPSTIAKASNPWTFSTCSVDVMASFLVTSDGACTLSETATGATDFSAFTGQEYGQRVHADAQCQARYGALSKFCRVISENYLRCQARYGALSKFCREDYLRGMGLTFDDMCFNMKCLNPISGTCVLVPAHDGTSCGDSKWCFKGLCVANAQAPSRLTNCPQLDDPTRSCSLTSCSDPLAVLIYCCSTCSQVSPSQPPSAPPSVGPSQSSPAGQGPDNFIF
ncbi:hypothetical protein RRG08_002429 [Elysia crispata]|uniref:Peptidase M12B domain-containing protein n=1 Tax=Elysia crispata TaxID=231223 RepID=A0AAE1DU60_9GAST|nr:hypothetical protein RRG08_002429 [Elysia crispata]